MSENVSSGGLDQLVGRQSSHEDSVNNNSNKERLMMMEDERGSRSGSVGKSESESPTKMDEYMEDPLPDLVGNLKIMEEPEPDLTVFDQEFVLEDFEFHISTSDEEDDGEIVDVHDDDDSGSDLEFFDATAAGSGIGGGSITGRGSTDLADGSLVPETENVSLDFVDQQPNFSINNCDQVPSSSGNSESANSKFANVKNAARKVATRVRIMVGKGKGAARQVRVIYHNLDKPYVARVSPAQHFKNFLTLGESNESGDMEKGGNVNKIASTCRILKACVFYINS